MDIDVERQELRINRKFTCKNIDAIVACIGNVQITYTKKVKTAQKTQTHTGRDTDLRWRGRVKDFEMRSASNAKQPGETLILCAVPLCAFQMRVRATPSVFNQVRWSRNTLLPAVLET